MSERVVVVTSSYPADPDDPSGHFVAADVARRRREGHEVTVLAPRTGMRGERGKAFPKTPHGDATGPAGERIVALRAGDAFGWPGVLLRVRERPTRALGVAAFVREARRALRSRGPWNRLVAHFVLPCVWPMLDGVAPRACTLEAFAHGSDVRLAARLPSPLRRRIALTLAPFDLRVSSEELRGELARAFGDALARRARVEPPPLDVPPLDRVEARRSLGVAPEERLLVVAGRLVPGKRTGTALRAARLVPGARVVVVGDGPERALLERDHPEASFVGLVARSRSLLWLAAADALVVASREEGSPSVVREARALGTPVVAVPSGDLRAWQRDDPGLLLAEIGRS